MFLAHKNTIKEGHYIPLEQYGKKNILANILGEFKIISNVCPHQQSLISTKKGFGSRVCPYHSWSFELDGSPKTSGRTEKYCKNVTTLASATVYEWNNLLFSEPVDFLDEIELGHLELVEQRVDIVKSNSETIMDLFLDVDHIPTVHKGVYDQIGITDTAVDWTYYKNGSGQVVKQGAKWLAVYPYTMIEWQQGALFITIAEPVSNNESKVYVFKYRDPYIEEREWETNEFVWETAWAQDKHQAELIVGVNIYNLEESKQHYRNWKNATNV